MLRWLPDDATTLLGGALVAMPRRTGAAADGRRRTAPGSFDRAGRIWGRRLG